MRRNMRYALTVPTLLTLLLSFAIAKYVAYPYPYIFVTLSATTVLSILLSEFSLGKDLDVATLVLKMVLPKRCIYILLVLSYVLLFIAPYLKLAIVSTVLSLIYYFVVGYCITKLTEFESLLDNLEIVIYSFVLGFTYIGLITFTAAILFEMAVIRYILLALILIHVVLLFKQMSRKSKELHIQFNLNPTTLFRWLMVSIVILSFYAFYYKDFVYISGTDISRHYMHSVNIVRNPIGFVGIAPDYYYLFHSSVGALIVLSGERNFALVNMLLIVIDIIYVLSIIPFIRVVSTYGKNIDSVLAFLSTFIFTGLGWLYILFNPPSNTLYYYSKLIEGNNKMYNNLMYTPSPFMWPVPLSFATATYLLSLTLLFKILRSEENVFLSSRFSLSLIAALLALAMSGSHPPEGVMHALILSLTILLTVKHRVSYTMNGLIIGFVTGYVAGGLVDIAITAISPHPVTVARIVAFLGSAILIGSTWLLRKVLWTALRPLHRIHFTLNTHQKTILSNIFLYFVIGLFMVGILTSLDMNNKFYTYAADPGGVIGLVPWFIYPILLGFVLPLGVAGMIYTLLHDRDPVSRLIIKVLVLTIVLSIIVGRTVSYLNISGVNTGYCGEKRFVMFVYLVLLPYAIYVLKHLVHRITKMHISVSTLAAIALSFLVLISFTNTLVIASFWNICADKYRVDSQEYIALTKLRDIVWNGTDRWILAPTIRSRNEVVFATPIYTTFIDPSINFRFTLPETTLRVLRSYGLETPYVYVDWRTDVKTVSSGWMGNVVIPSIATKVLEIGPISAYDIPPLAPVLPSSSTALVLPTYRDLIPWIDKVFLLLSRLGLNYTTVLETDPDLLSNHNYETLILPYDPITAGMNITIDALSKEFAGFWKGVSGVATFENGVLRLGDPERLVMENIAVWRSISSMGIDAINVSLVFRIEKYDPKVLNYVHLVYDYIDKDNYKYLGIMLNEKGQVYALNCSKVEGKYVCNPPWPGVYIGNDFNPSIEHRLNISFELRKGVASLKLDNYKPISFMVKVNGGSIGIRVDRFHSVVIENVTLGLKMRPLISLKDLLDTSPEDNRTVVVLNTMGYGDLYKILQKEGYTTLLRTSEVNVYLKHVNASTIIYLDLKTSLNDILNNEDVIAKISRILQHYSEAFDAKSYKHSIMLHTNVVANNVICRSADIVARSFILMPAEDKGLCIDNVCFNKSAIEFLALKPNENGLIKLKAINVSILGGNGFYSTIRASRVVVPANTVVQLYLANFSVSTLKIEQDFTIHDAIIIAKTPTIITDEAVIRGVLYQGLKYPYLAKDLVLRGNTTVKYVVGDNLLALQTAASSIEFIENLKIYNEFDSLPLLFRYSVIYIVALILVHIPKLLRREVS